MELLGLKLKYQDDVSIDKILMFSQYLNTINWSDEEIKNLPNIYTKNNTHIALETADLHNDKEIFFKILNRNDKKYREIYKLHLHLTAFDFNFYNRNADEFIDN